MVRVIGIHASPRRYGETYKLLRVALEAAKREGAEVEQVHLYDYTIKPCIGCVSDDIYACRFPCIIEDDDFNRLGEILLRSNAFIIATPVYWYSVSGLLKDFIDRLTSMENMIYHTGRSLLEGKVAGFIAVGNDTGALMTIAWLMSVFNSMGVHIPAWALAYHERKESVTANKAALLDAANVGSIVVRAARLLSREKEWYRSELSVLAEEVATRAEEEAKIIAQKELASRRQLYRGERKQLES